MNEQSILDGQTRAVRLLHEHEATAMEQLKQEILDQLADLRQGKSIYDQHFPWWSKHIFGDASYAHEIVKKALRAASLVEAGATGDQVNEYVDKLEDQLFDILNFAVMWLAWRRYIQREEVADEDSTHSPASEPVQPAGW